MVKKLSVLILGLVAVLALAACKEDSSVVNASGYYLAIDINPSIEFIVDEENNIVSYNFINEDAAILCADIDFTGMNVDAAIELYLSLATEAGYIDVDSEDNAILITVLSGEEDTQESEQLLEQLRTRLRERVMTYMASNSINGQVLSEDYTQADLLAQADELGVSPGKLRLALLASDADENLTLDDALNTSVKDLLSNIKEHQQECIGEMTQEQINAYVQQRTQLRALYQAKYEAHVAANPELTEEQINQRIEVIKNRYQNMTQEEWQNMVETYQQALEERRNSQNNEE